MALIRAISGSSGGGGNAKSGMVPNGTFSGTNIDYEIDTGLSSITNFMLHGELDGYTYPYKQIVYYDGTTDKYDACVIYENGSGSGKYNISVNSIADSRCFKVKSVTGGKITISTLSNASYSKVKNCVWFAE